MHRLCLGEEVCSKESKEFPSSLLYSSVKHIFFLASDQSDRTLGGKKKNKHTEDKVAVKKTSEQI